MTENKLKVGLWVMAGDSPALVVGLDEEHEDAIIKKETVFGPYEHPYSLCMLRPWTIDDARKGQYLTCEDSDGRKFIFITKGNPDTAECIAGCTLEKDFLWIHSNVRKELIGRIHPSTNEEISLLNDFLEGQHLHFDLDRRELIRIENHVHDVDYKRQLEEEGKDIASNDFRSIAAKDILCSLLSSKKRELDKGEKKMYIKISVEMADMLIDELNKK